jgi:predicted molibdopterin-dependent oxidoreductase YjgC
MEQESFSFKYPSVRKLLEAREAGSKSLMWDVGHTAHSSCRHPSENPSGTSGALALAMANVIIRKICMTRSFVENYTIGFEEYQAYVDGFSRPGGRDYGCFSGKDCPAARLYATTKPAGLMTSSNATTHHTNGLQNHRAITTLVGLTGNYDVPEAT